LKNKININGTNGNLTQPKSIINVGNSGTTLRFLTGICSLINGRSMLTGDSSVTKRPIIPLLSSLNNLGANCKFEHKKSRVVVNGKLRGGITAINGLTSQFTSSLLFTTPLGVYDSIIQPMGLREKPYVDMTIFYLKEAGIDIDFESDYNQFFIPGNQEYRSSNITIPGDYSSAAFILAAASITNSKVTLRGLDINDSQADQKIIKILQDMGTKISQNKGSIIIDGSDLKGIEIDLSNNPDLLPILAVVGACAKGETILKNVEQARIKETDRIVAMRNELAKMGANIKELKDGLVIKQSKLVGNSVQGYNDHRVVMSLAVAGLVARGKTSINTAQSFKVTYPTFVDTLKKLNAKIFSEVDS